MSESFDYVFEKQHTWNVWRSVTSPELRWLLLLRLCKKPETTKPKFLESGWKIKQLNANCHPHVVSLADTMH